MSEHKLREELPKAERVRQMLDTDDEQLITDMVEGETDLLECAAVVLEAIDESEMMLAGMKEYEKTLAARKSRLQVSIERRKGLLLGCMERLGLKTLKLPTATLSASKGRQKVIITGESYLPEYLLTTTVTPNKKLILEKLTYGATVPGATLSNAETTLTIRRK